MLRRSKKSKYKISEVEGNKVILDYSLYCKGHRPRKKALLSYLTGPVISEIEGEQLVRFSNHGLATSWARVLNELGYTVDIIDWDNASFRTDKKYDLLIFHGAKNFNTIMDNLSGRPKIIHWLTGSYWRFNNSEEDKRLEHFKKRHGIIVPRDRFIIDGEDEVNEAANGIIVLGDPSMRSTYPSDYRKVLTVNNASYPDDHFDTIKKDYEDTKRSFLFFAGSGNIHKGLDLLIDAFKKLPNQHLYIVAHTDKEVMDVFKNELKLPNIHMFGEVGMRTEQFYEVMDKCAFIILPSCSEGQAGSVVEAMNQGLVPLVSKETRLDTRGYGFTLEDCSISTIKEAVKTCSALSAEEVSRLSHATRRKVAEEHTPDFFRKQLKAAIKDIIG